MKNIFSIALVILSLQVMAQSNKIQKSVNKVNSDFNNANNQINDASNTINNTAGGVNESINSLKGAVNTISGLWQSAKVEIKPKDKNDVTLTASNKQSAERQTSNKQQSAKPEEAIQETTNAESGMQTSMTTITVSNCNFAILKELASGLETSQYVSKVEKSLANGTARLVIMHVGTTDEVTFFIDSKLKNRFDIQGFSEGTIVLSVKP